MPPKMHDKHNSWITFVLSVIFLACSNHSSVRAAPKCPGGLTEGVLWPNVTADHNATMPCPLGIGEAVRNCSKEGRWQTIDFTGCSLEDLEVMKEQLTSSSLTLGELYDVAEDLVFLTSNNVTLSGHVIASQDILQDLMSKPLTDYSDFDLVRGLVQNIIHSSGDLLHANQDWDNIAEFQNPELCRAFVIAIEEYGKNVTTYLSNYGRNGISCETSNNLKAKYISTKGDITIAESFNVQGSSAKVTIPNSVFVNEDASGNVGVAVLVFTSDIANWVETNITSPRKNDKRANVHSNLVSCTFHPDQQQDLADPISIEFEVITRKDKSIPNNTCSTISIVNKSSSVWRQEGITTAIITDVNETARCITSKITGPFFAVVEVKMYRTTLPYVVTTALAFSLILFFVTFIILMYANRSLESDRATLVLFFLITLIFGYITEVSGLYATDNFVACKIVSLVLHFSSLSYFFWMLGQVVQLILKVTYKTVEAGSVAQFCALGWITPSFVVASSAGLQWDYYGKEESCSIPLYEENSLAFIFPMVLVAVTTTICLLCTIREYCKIKRSERKLMYRMRRILPNIRALLVVLPLLVVVWSVGAVAIHREQTALDVVWALVLIISSVCIFLFYGVFSSEVQTEYELRYGPCCGKKRGAIQDSPRPGWRDEISQLSQIREPSSIGRDADSTTTNGALPGTSGLQVPTDGMDDPGPWSPREHIGDSAASLNASVSSSIALKTKLKVFPLRKTQEQLSPRRTFQETLT